MAELGKEDKPVLLKKSVIERNLSRHPEIEREEYNELLGESLYNKTQIFSGFKDDYVNFVRKMSDKDNSLVLIELAEGKSDYEVVHIMKINDNNLRRMKRKKP